MRLRRLPLLIAAALGLSACTAGTPTSQVTLMRSDGVTAMLDWATHDGPLLVEVLNHPFAPAQMARTDAVVARAVEQSMPGRSIRAVTDRAARPDPAYWLRIVLDAPVTANAATLCARAPAPPANAEATLHVVMAVCGRRGAEAWTEAAVRGRLARPDGPDAPALTTLLHQMNRQMFRPRRDSDSRPPQLL